MSSVPPARPPRPDDVPVPANLPPAPSPPAIAPPSHPPPGMASSSHAVRPPNGRMISPDIPVPAVPPPAPTSRLVAELKAVDYASNSPEYWDMFGRLSKQLNHFGQQSMKQVHYLRSHADLPSGSGRRTSVKKGAAPQRPSMGRRVSMQVELTEEDKQQETTEEFQDFVQYLNDNNGGKYKQLGQKLCQLGALHAQMQEVINYTLATWRTDLRNISALGQSQQNYEDLEGEYLTKIKKFLNKKPSDDAKSVEEEKGLALKGHFLKLQRFDMLSQLQLISNHRQLTALRPVSGLLRAYLKYQRAAANVMDDNFEEEIAELDEYIKGMQRVRDNDEKQRRELRRQVEKELFTSTKEFQGSTTGTGTGIRDLDEQQSKVSSVSKEGFLFLPSESVVSSGQSAQSKQKQAQSQHFTAVWCVIKDGFLAVRTPPTRPAPDLLSDAVDTQQLETIQEESSGVEHPKSKGNKKGFGGLFGAASKLFQSSQSRNFYVPKESGTKSHKPSNETFPLLLCTVKEERSLPVRFAFSVISPQRTVTLQAESSSVMREWIDALNSAISTELNNQPGREKKAHKGSVIDNVTSVQQSAAEESKRKVATNALLSVPGNDVCAECGKPEPEWVSLNLGVLLCLTCSGIHRQLGVHISKMRSLQLDALDRFQMQLLTSLGNVNANSIWEYKLQQGILKEPRKPDPDADREVRQLFITSKYRDRVFVDDNNTYTQADLNQHLFAATNEQDLLRMVTLLAQGGSPDWANPEEDHRTALAQAVFLDFALGVELFIQNGAQLDAIESRGWTLIHYCAYYNYPEIAELILLRGGQQLMLLEDSYAHTPHDTAQEAQLQQPDVDYAPLLAILSKAERRQQREHAAANSAPSHPAQAPSSSSPASADQQKKGFIGSMWKGIKKGF